MKILVTIGFILTEVICFGQFRGTTPPNEYYSTIVYPGSRKTFLPNVMSDPIQNVRQTSPLMTNLSSSDWRAPNNSFWTGTVTTMSFNKGKFGTLYYWDVQGNLRGTRGFIDISGKDKRGFKLVFPWKIFR